MIIEKERRGTPEGVIMKGKFRVGEKEFRYFGNAVNYVFNNYENPFNVKIFDCEHGYYI